MLDPAFITRNILADKPRVTRFPIDWNAAPGDAGAASAEPGSNEGTMDEDEVGQGEEIAEEVDDDMGMGDENVGDEIEVSQIFRRHSKHNAQFVVPCVM